MPNNDFLRVYTATGLGGSKRDICSHANQRNVRCRRRARRGIVWNHGGIGGTGYGKFCQEHADAKERDLLGKGYEQVTPVKFYGLPPKKNP